MTFHNTSSLPAHMLGEANSAERAKAAKRNGRGYRTTKRTPDYDKHYSPHALEAVLGNLPRRG